MAAADPPRTAVMANASTTLSVAHVTVRRGEHVIVDDVSVDVRPLEIHGVVGASGSGKTTLLEAIAGVVAHSGDVSLGPVPLDREARQPHVHYVPARTRAFDDATVARMLAFVAASLRAHQGAVDDVVAKLALGPLVERRLRTLLMGERKRAQLAAALLVPRGTLLVDEPFGGLDVRGARNVADVLRTATNERRTLLLALSSPSSAEKLCDRFTLLSNGRVVGRGQIHELREAARAHPGASLDEVMHALA